jgi:hypothetical protein
MKFMFSSAKKKINLFSNFFFVVCYFSNQIKIFRNRANHSRDHVYKQ